ncbi:MAG: site-specific DNA-methyltransferase [Pseudomonadota bacterium]
MASDTNETAKARDSYDGLTRQQLIRLLRKRDAERKLGLVWERDEIEADKAIDANFVVTDLIEDQCERPAPWENLVIEGDNYDALRWLRMTHKGRVKCIYIDPPYNTGNKDWVYNDDFRDPNDRYFQSTWLEFLYQRFLIARDLLSPDGVILVSINDEQRAKLELMMDQALPGMRVGTLTWRTRQGSNADQGSFLSGDHEHVLAFGGNAFRFCGTEKTFSMYKFDDNDGRGRYRKDNLTLGFNFLERPNLFYPLRDPSTDVIYPPNPDRVWVYPSRQRSKAAKTRFMEEWIADGYIVFPTEPKVVTFKTKEELLSAIRANEVPLSGRAPLLREDLPDLDFWIGKKIGFGTPSFKRYKKDLRNQTQPLSSWITPRAEEDTVLEGSNTIVSGTNDEGAKVIKDVFGSKAFNYAKPVSLIRELVRQSTSSGDLLLDFFAGSATTAQAVMELNAENGGDRRFIMVSSTEATKDEPEKNLCRDVTAERIRRLNASGDKKYAELSAGFAYLRTREIDPLAIDTELTAPAAWNALEALHGLPLTTWDATASHAVHEADSPTTLVLVDKVAKKLATDLEKALRPGRRVFVYAFAPGQVRDLGLDGQFEIRDVRETLTRLFKA